MKRRRKPNVVRKAKEETVTSEESLPSTSAVVESGGRVNEDVINMKREILDAQGEEEDEVLKGEQSVFDMIIRNLIDDVSLGLCFEVHRAAKIGTLDLDEIDQDCQKQFAVCQARGLDVFGLVPTKKQMDCECPSCNRPMAASRFAPHLEKCMGMGRNSSRIASRRIASAQKKDGGGSEEEEEEEEVQKDEEWGGDKKGKRGMMKRERSGCMLKRLLKLPTKPTRNGDAQSTSSDPGAHTSYETMGQDDRKHLLAQTCGVISEHTKKMCTKTLRCPQHSDQQRKSVRVFLLSSLPDSGLVDEVDVDSIHDDDIDGIILDHHISSPSPTPSESSLILNKRRPGRKVGPNKKRRH